ncbi:hypothetical protein [Burkholderia pseudomallei]|uniref:hypothetical protein n=1 Tax=Burkholderia pseudomallei TaxID=28450 RepID=UPI0009B1FD09
MNPDVDLSDKGLKITPLDDATPAEADVLTQQAYDLMPRVKITDLLFEVDQWTNFTPHFTHLKSDAEPPDRTLLLTGDYVWHANKRVAKGRFRPLRHRKSAGPPWRTKKSVS